MPLGRRQLRIPDANPMMAEVPSQSPALWKIIGSFILIKRNAPVLVERARRSWRHAERYKTSQADYRLDLDLVFADPSGEHFKPDSVTATACLIAHNAGLTGVGLHSLRHSHGSQLLSEGVSLPTVSRRLGHSSPDITARVYAHSFKSDEVDAARIWDESVGAVLQTNVKSDLLSGSVAGCSNIGPELLIANQMCGSANGNRTRI